jgi:transcription-repair coupling factor (superfamily II helicase)
MHEVGYALYTDMLERAVRDIKAGRNPSLERPLDQGTEIELRAPALIPESYLPDVHGRLVLYKRIANAPNDEALVDLKAELIDRFGLLPEPTQTLFEIAALKQLATPIGVRKIDFGPDGGRLAFHADPDVDPARIIELIQTQSKRYRLDGPDRLRITAELPELHDRLNECTRLLEWLAESKRAA